MHWEAKGLKLCASLSLRLGHIFFSQRAIFLLKVFVQQNSDEDQCRVFPSRSEQSQRGACARTVRAVFYSGGGGQESLGRIMIHKRLVSPPVKESAPSSANPKRFLNIRGYKDFWNSKGTCFQTPVYEALGQDRVEDGCYARALIIPWGISSCMLWSAEWQTGKGFGLHQG